MNTCYSLKMWIFLPGMWNFFILFLFHTFNFEISRLPHTIVIVDGQGSPGNNKTVSTTEHRVANRTWAFYEERSGGSSHREERLFLPSKLNTLYKLIRLLELVPDGGEIELKTDRCQQQESKMKHKAKSGAGEIWEQVGDWGEKATETWDMAP